MTVEQLHQLKEESRQEMQAVAAQLAAAIAAQAEAESHFVKIADNIWLYV